MRLFTALALVAALVPAGSDAQSVQVPGTSVVLTPPQGFRVARSFPGLENPTTASRIEIAEYPPAQFAEVSSVFASPKTASTRYASEGVRFTRIEPVAIEGGSAPLAVGQQAKNGVESQKYVTVLGGGEANTVLVTFTLGARQQTSRADVENVVRSIRVRRPPTPEETIAGLAFTFKAAPPFRFSASADPNSALLTTFDGPDTTGGKPVAQITRAATMALPSESAKTAEQNLQAMAANAVIKQRAATPFAGGQGAFLSATVDNRTVMLFLRVLPGGTYLQFLAVGETLQLADVEQAVRETAASIDLR